MTEREAATENLHQIRDEVDRLFAEAQAALRKAQAANSDYRATLLAACSTKANDDDGKT